MRQDDAMTQVKKPRLHRSWMISFSALFAAVFHDDVIRRTAPRVDQQADDAVHVELP